MPATGLDLRSLRCADEEMEARVDYALSAEDRAQESAENNELSGRSVTQGYVTRNGAVSGGPAISSFAGRSISEKRRPEAGFRLVHRRAAQPTRRPGSGLLMLSGRRSKPGAKSVGEEASAGAWPAAVSSFYRR
ncbi:hypothetical protein MRX96_054874 [Rhipicephalus microplus]